MLLKVKDRRIPSGAQTGEMQLDILPLLNAARTAVQAEGASQRLPPPYIFRTYQDFHEDNLRSHTE